MSTVDAIKQYTRSYDELPNADDDNLIDPDYKNFYQSSKPTILSRLTRFLRIQRSPILNMDDFKKLLDTITERREVQSLQKNTILHLAVKPQTTIYLWSNVHGYFHSLARSLNFLKSQNIINNDLKIIAPDTYFVFNGNFIDGAPYNIETLYIILLLLEHNIDKVFYMRGAHETKGYWKNFGFKTELMIRAADSNSEAIPLGSAIDRFFETLPLALYISIENKPADVIRISPLSRKNYDIINENLMGNLFSTNRDAALIGYDPLQKKESSTLPDIKVIITIEDMMKNQRIIEGVGLLDQDFGATSWGIISAPTVAHRAYYNFFSDAYAVITCGSTIDESDIALFKNDIKETKGFQLYKTYNLVTAISSDHPAYKQERKNDILIGSSMSLEQGVAIMGHRVSQGISVRINEVNQTGGVNGHHIRLIIKNDDYIPYLARQNIINFMRDGINTILLPIGSPTVQAYLDFIKQNKILVLFPITGSSQFRDPSLKGLVHYRVDYTDEVTVLINHLVTEYNTRKFAFFFQDDAYGQGPLSAAHNELKKHAIDEWVDVPYTRATLNLEKQVQEIRASQADAIGLFSSAKTTEELIRQINVAELSNKQLFGISFLGEESFRFFIKNHGLQVLLGAVVPNPAISDLEIIKEYRHAMDQNSHTYDVFSLEAYIATSILIEMMRQIEGPISNEKILEKLESLNNFAFKGLLLSFNPKHRDLSQPVWIETEKDKNWHKYEIDKK
jgi:branched-chain amino acid transport system substrate-binding protein